MRRARRLALLVAWGTPLPVLAAPGPPSPADASGVPESDPGASENDPGAPAASGEDAPSGTDPAASGERALAGEATPDRPSGGSPAEAEEVGGSSSADGLEPFDEPGPSVHGARHLAPLLLELRVGLGSRRLGYVDDLFGSLRRHAVEAAPLVRATAEWYPARHFTDTALGDVGLAVAHERWWAPASRRSGVASPYATEAGFTRAGLRLRTALGASRFTFGYEQGVDRFVVAPGDLLRPSEVPSVRYRHERLGVRWELPVAERFSIGAPLAVSHATRSGDVASAAWFPHASSWAWEVGLDVGGSPAAGVTVLVGLEWQRWVLALAPRPGEPNVAGGASDDRIRAALALRWQGGR